MAALGRWPELGDRPLVVTHGGVLRALDRRCGIDPPARADNLAGRWFEVDGDGRLVPGERVVLVAI